MMKATIQVIHFQSFVQPGPDVGLTSGAVDGVMDNAAAPSNNPCLLK
jgi:hypothetical protein